MKVAGAISDRRRTTSSSLGLTGHANAEPLRQAGPEAVALFNVHRQRVFEQLEEVPRPVRVFAIAHKVLNDLALAIDMHSTFRNMPFGLGKVIDENLAVHAQSIAPLPLLRRHGARLRRKKEKGCQGKGQPLRQDTIGCSGGWVRAGGTELTRQSSFVSKIT